MPISFFVVFIVNIAYGCAWFILIELYALKHSFEGLIPDAYYV